MTMTFELDIDSIKINQDTKYLGRKSLLSRLTHTDRLFY